ncbi:MAG: hypothetical protein K0U39_05660 [Alphaproteobacteria bacterium]|nr:hypothetical protein [Alphaproteobacteria bacterium]
MIKDMLCKRNIVTILILYISFVFIQSLFFKYTASAETIHIFGILNAWAEDSFGISGLFLPPGIFNAYVIGTAELLASICLLTGLFSRFKICIPLGAFMALGIISGAICFHLFTPLGVNVLGDMGLLFILACGVWASAITLIVIHKDMALNFVKNRKR